MAREDRLTTLELLWAAWEQHGQALSAGAVATTDPAWRLDRADAVRPRGRMAVWALAPGWQVREAPPTHATAAALLGDFNRPDGIASGQADQVAAGAREDAATYTAAQLIQQFAVAGPWAIATARQLGPVVVDYFGRALLRLDEAVSIGILEATVHLLDLQRALGVPPDVPAAGVEHTVALLAEMAPPLDFIELATGRSSVALFPVLR